jgi:hypothetical protein
MKGLGASTMLSKKIKAEKATIQETFVVFWQIKSTLENVSVKDDDRQNHPVSNLYIFTESYVLQKKENLQSGKSGGFLLTNFGVAVLHTKQLWEAMGISRGQLPITTIIDQYGNEEHHSMTMNGIIIHVHSLELISRMRKIIKFPPFHYASGTYGNQGGIQ